ncbi:MAG: FAD-binding monooxygenase, partial [Ardenticatenaceae bacterium]
GYARAEESEVTVRMGYASRLYRRDPAGPHARDWILVTPDATRERRGGGMFPVEGERWVVTLAGRNGDYAPTDEAGFLEFARSLPSPDIYHLIRHSEPLSDIVQHRFPSSLRRHYETLRRFPERYLVMGDAVCSFNPIYGQGMTSAALQAAELDQLLGERGGTRGLHGIAQPYFKRVAKVVDTPWWGAVGEDFRYPETEGPKAPGTDLINAYMVKVHRVSHHDRVVCAAFLKVMNLMEPPTSLFHPRILWRVWRGQSRQAGARRSITPVLQR